MKKIKWIAIVLIGVATKSYAQYTPSGGAPHAYTPAGSATNPPVQAGSAVANQAKQMQAQLKLTDVQTTRLTAVLQQIDNEHANDKTAQANFKNWQATRNTKAMINFVLKQMDADALKIEQILTPEQNKTFQKMIAKRRDGLKKMADAQK